MLWGTCLFITCMGVIHGKGHGPRGVGHALATFEFLPNFSQVYIEFCQSLFSVSERLTYYVLKYDNFKSIEVQG